MQRRQFTAGVLAPSLGGSVGGALLGLPGLAWALTEGDAAAGVRAALQKAALAAVGQLGRADGFLGDQRVRIGLPPALEKAGDALRKLGQGKRVDELVTGMNRAAEQAVPLARPLLENAVRRMSVEDAIGLVRGSDTAVTDFFSAKTRQPLAEAFAPVVRPVTERLSLARRHDELVGRAAKLGLVKGEPRKVHEHVTDKAMDGLFLMLAEQERQLRANPLAAGNALLKKVFGR
jgi:Protein of unknown function (DUF4197)